MAADWSRPVKPGGRAQLACWCRRRLLTFESEGNPPLGQPLLAALKADTDEGRLDLGCVAAHGTFGCDPEGCFAITPQAKRATAFLFELSARL